MKNTKERKAGAFSWIAGISSIMYLIAGLGNPDKKYESTRHNTGFMALDKLAGLLGTEVRDKKFKGLCGTSSYKGEKLLLLKPLTYMNNSGEAVRAAADFYKIEPDLNPIGFLIYCGVIPVGLVVTAAMVYDIYSKRPGAPQKEPDKKQKRKRN